MRIRHGPPIPNPLRSCQITLLWRCINGWFSRKMHGFFFWWIETWFYYHDICIDNYNSYWLNYVKIEILKMCNRTIKSYLLPQHFNKYIETKNQINKLIIIFLVAKYKTSKKTYHILLNDDACCFSSALVIWQLSNR